jgi:hypothetical protein
MEKQPPIDEPETTFSRSPIPPEVYENYKNQCVILNEAYEVIASAPTWEEIPDGVEGIHAYISGDETLFLDVAA